MIAVAYENPSARHKMLAYRDEAGCRYYLNQYRNQSVTCPITDSRPA